MHTVLRHTLMWFEHVECMGDREFTKMVYEREVEGSGVRGKPLVRWESRAEWSI